MPSVFNVPSQEVRSEWVHVKTGMGGWQRLCLVECEDSTFHFCQVWERTPQFSISLTQISHIIDCQVLYPDKKGIESRVILNLVRTQESKPLMTRLLQVFKVRKITMHLFVC